jgi:hypothetical protein
MSYIYRPELKPSRETLERFRLVLELSDEEVDEWAFYSWRNRVRAETPERRLTTDAMRGAALRQSKPRDHERLSKMLSPPWSLSYAEAAKVCKVSASTVQADARQLAIRVPGDGQHRGKAEEFLHHEQGKKLTDAHVREAAERHAVAWLHAEELGPYIHVITRDVFREAEGIGSAEAGRIVSYFRALVPKPAGTSRR